MHWIGFAFLSAIGAQFFRVGIKSLKDFDPALMTVLAFTTTLLVSLGVLVMSGKSAHLKDVPFSHVLIPLVMIGIGQTIIFFMFTRSLQYGAQISLIGFVVNTITNIMSLIVGYYFFGDKLTIRNIYGILLALVSLYLMIK